MTTSPAGEQFEPGDLVRVRGEHAVSVVVLPTGRKPDQVPEDCPDLGEQCCVPVVLIRTPMDDDLVGDKRWVLLADVRLAEGPMRDAEDVGAGGC